MLFRKHQYDNAIIFGHAKDGNLHFVITQSFNNQAVIDQYARFIDDVVELVVERYDGALKAEHGTGRNMAPFVETEWGSDGYEIMRRLKQLADPHNLLNPGVIINPDRQAHLANLKQLPSVEPEIDKCIECGYCEPKCPSRELTLTPRQRIVVRREMATTAGRWKLFRSLCGARPRVSLHGARYLRYRWHVCDRVSGEHRHGPTGKTLPQGSAHRLRQQAWAVRIANNFALTERALRWALRLGHAAEKVIGVGGMRALTRAMKRVAGDNLSEWMPDTPSCRGSSSPYRRSRSTGGLFSIVHLARDGEDSRRAQRLVADGSDGRVGTSSRRAGVYPERRRRHLLWNAILVEGA